MVPLKYAVIGVVVANSESGTSTSGTASGSAAGSASGSTGTAPPQDNRLNEVVDLINKGKLSDAEGLLAELGG